MFFLRQPKVYQVYLKEFDEHPMEGAQFVPETFNMIAFVIPVFWALYQRLWISAVVVFCVFSLNSGLWGITLGTELGYGVEMAAMLWLGLNGNDLVTRRLERDGYALYDVVVAQNYAEAQRRFLDHAHLSGAHLSEPAAPKSSAIPKPIWS